jgi:acyl carrier protein
MRQAIASQLGVDLDEITADSTLEQLGADSLDLVELEMELSDEFNVPEADAVDALKGTVDDIWKAVEKHQ